MPVSDAYNKADRLYEVQMLFWKNPKRRFTTPEIAISLGVSEDTALRYLNILERTGRLPLVKEGRFWVLMEGAAFTLPLPAITLSSAEATALSIAGRLLSQIHDERNTHVTQALLKIVSALPEPVAAHQHTIVEIAKERQQNQPDRSAIFEALAIGWVTQHRVQLRYTTAEGKAFKCKFDPYLFEPTGIGRTIYIIGHSNPPDKLLTLKLERIERAELLENEPFDLPPKFDGPALLKKAWVVMFGEQEPVMIRLRFTSRVVTRLKETLWHPTQQVKDTAEGGEMTLSIGDTLEIENWIRGWGPDCEVLEPQELRDKMIEDIRRSARTYGINVSGAAAPDEADEELFDTFFGGE
jgi:predicted DNA-binding transcriptional regulator YafY